VASDGRVKSVWFDIFLQHPHHRLHHRADHLMLNRAAVRPGDLMLRAPRPAIGESALQAPRARLPGAVVGRLLQGAEIPILGFRESTPRGREERAELGHGLGGASLEPTANGRRIDARER
jgi:hypothetical protein